MSYVSDKRKMINRILVGTPLTIIGFMLMWYVAGNSLVPGVIEISYIGLIPFLVGLLLGTVGLYILTLPITRRFDF